MSQQDTPSDRRDASDYLAIVGRRWMLVVAIMVIVAGIAVGVSLLRPTTYQASARVLVASPVRATSASSGVVVSTEEVATQAVVAASYPVATLASKGVPGTSPQELIDHTTVSPLGEARVLEVSVQADSAQGAAQRANAMAKAYVDYSDSLTARGQSRVEEAAAAKLVSVQSQLHALHDKMKAQGSYTDQALTTQEQVLQSQVGALMSAIDDSQTGTVVRSSSAGILTSATQPGSPASPRPLFDGALGAFLGLLIGVLAALLADRLGGEAPEKSKSKWAARSTKAPQTSNG